MLQQTIVRKRHLLFFRQGRGSDRGKAHVTIRLMPRIVHDLVRLQLRQHPAKRTHIRYTDNDDVRYAIRRLGEGSEGEDRVTGLNYLVLYGDVLPDEDVNVTLSDLCHAREHTLGYDMCQQKFSTATLRASMLGPRP